jgi:hypothetical protein
MAIRLTPGDLRSLIRETIAKPSFEEAKQVLTSYAYREAGSTARLKRFCKAMGIEANPYKNLMLQYLMDARLPDSDPQKEGMDTSDYLNLALDELRGLYPEEQGA